MALLLNIFDNPSGWGPGNDLPDAFKAIPFAPFNKADKVGKVLDWEQQQPFQQRGRFPQSAATASSSSFAYKHEEDETSFQLVDNKPQKRAPMFGSLGRRSFAQRRVGGAAGGASGAAQGGWQSRGRGGGAAGGPGGRQVGGGRVQQAQQQLRYAQQAAGVRKGAQPAAAGGRFAGNKRFFDKVVRPRDSSVDVHKSWKHVASLPLSELAKLKAESVPEAEDLATFGQLEQFDGACEQIRVKTERPLRKFDSRLTFHETTSDDPVLADLRASGAGTVYGTDAILSVLMGAARSVYSWDLVVRKEGDTLVWDKRAKSNIDALTVHETGNEVGLELDDESSVNHPAQLSAEATAVNHYFTQQALVKEGEKWTPEEAKAESPFLASVEAGAEVASVLYRYRRWSLGGGLQLVARTELNAFGVKKGSAERQLLCVRALNEFDSKATGAVDFRQKLDSQASAVLATELKNNGAKLSRWAAQALLAGADEVKLGFVTRSNPRDTRGGHVVLGVQRHRAAELATQLSCDAGRMFATLRRICETVRAQPDGTYLLLKEPNEAKLTLFSVSDNFDIHDDQANSDDDE